jgi:Fe-S oxidoreductase
LRVALIAGCVQRVIFPNVNAATIRVLTAEGCDVVVPALQGCCGVLSLHSGRAHEAKRLAGKLVTAFEREQVDAIIINAAGCGSTLKQYGELFAADDDVRLHRLVISRRRARAMWAPSTPEASSKDAPTSSRTSPTPYHVAVSAAMR